MKKIGKTILMVFGVLAVITLLVFVFKTMGGDSKEVRPMYAIGCIDEKGEVDESELSIYTIKAFKFEILVVDWNEDNDGSYQVFFYDEDGEFVASTIVYTDDAEIAMLEGAETARLVITPGLEKNDTINFLEIAKYSKYLTLENKTVEKTE